jgi:hypothetical protein
VVAKYINITQRKQIINSIARNANYQLRKQYGGLMLTRDQLTALRERLGEGEQQGTNQQKGVRNEDYQHQY